MNEFIRFIAALRAAMLCATGVALAALAPTVNAASFTGKVSLPDGKPAFGAMVTIFNAGKSARQTVYTAADGTFAIQTPYAGKLDVRARLANYDDAIATVESAAEAVNQLDLALMPFASKESISDALSASAHNARLGWSSASDKAVFVSQCNFCHQMGNATTRAPRSHDVWLGTIRKMEGMLAMVTRSEKDRFAGVLAKGFDGTPVDAKHDYGATPELARAKVEEWLVGGPTTFIHDLDVAEDGLLYGTDEGHDMLYVLDPKSGAIAEYKQPDIDLPRAGKFSGMQLPIGIFTGKHGPHSMGQTKDGRLWITNSLSSTLHSFDPKTKQFKVYPVGNDALYPHTVRVDQDDIVWFTIVASNQLGRFDPKTEKMTVTRLPHNGFWRWVSDMLLPTLLRVSAWFPDNSLMLEFSHHRFLGYTVLAFPYGIDVHPRDGSIWYAKLYANKIGRVDPKTLERVDSPAQIDSWNRTWVFLEWTLRPYEDRSKPVAYR